MLVEFVMMIISRSPVLLLLSSALVLFHLVAVLVECAPNNAVIVEINSTEVLSIDGTLGTVDPVKYDGAQLWRIPFDNQYQKNIVIDLQNNFGKSLFSNYCVTSQVSRLKSVMVLSET